MQLLHSSTCTLHTTLLQSSTLLTVLSSPALLFQSH